MLKFATTTAARYQVRRTQDPKVLDQMTLSPRTPGLMIRDQMAQDQRIQGETNPGLRKATQQKREMTMLAVSVVRSL